MDDDVRMVVVKVDVHLCDGRTRVVNCWTQKNCLK